MITVFFDNEMFQIAFVVILGLALGSFSTALVYRTRNNQSWIWNSSHKDASRSFCPYCHHTLGVKNLIPIFSWLFQCGRCSYCDIKIPLEYIVLEVVVVCLCFSIYAVFGFGVQSVILMFVAPFFVSFVLLVVKYKLLPKILLCIVIIGVASTLFL